MKFFSVKLLLLTVGLLFVTIGKADIMSENAINSALKVGKRPMSDQMKDSNRKPKGCNN